MRPLPLVSVLGVNAGRELARRTSNEYQSDDHEFGGTVEDTAGQLLRRTGACWCQCVLRPGRRCEVDGRERMRLRLRSDSEDDAQDTVLRLIYGGVSVACARKH